MEQTKSAQICMLFSFEKNLLDSLFLFTTTTTEEFPLEIVSMKRKKKIITQLLNALSFHSLGLPSEYICFYLPQWNGMKKRKFYWIIYVPNGNIRFTIFNFIKGLFFLRWPLHITFIWIHLANTPIPLVTCWLTQKINGSFWNKKYIFYFVSRTHAYESA